MEHPIMYRDDDFGLAEVRRICLAFPEAHETISFGRPWFRVKTAFAVFGGGARTPDTRMFPSGLLFLPDEDTRLALLQDERAFVPAYLGPKGWMGSDLTAAPVDWQEVTELVDESYRNTAPKRLVAVLLARAQALLFPFRPDVAGTTGTTGRNGNISARRSPLCSAGLLGRA